jgi:hypothetical protein
MDKIIDLDREIQAPVVEMPIASTGSRGNVPPGYIPIELSTNGKLGVPKVVHIRNFTTGDLVELSLYSTDIVPEKLISVINSLSFDKIDVGTWPDRSIIELMVKMYMNYFTPMMYNIYFPWDETDLEFLNNAGRHEEADALEKGKLKPEIDLDLRNLNFINLNDSIKSFVIIKKKATQFSNALEAKFLAYPRFGDIVLVKKAVEDRFYEEDKKYAKVKQDVSIIDRYIEEGRSVDIIGVVDPLLYAAWQKHEFNKSLYLIKSTQALYLHSFNGRDLSNASIDEKIKVLDNPEFDIKIGRVIEQQYNKLNFGIDPIIKVKNPFTGLICDRRFSFRIVDILSAIQSYRVDGYDIVYDD